MTTPTTATDSSNQLPALQFKVSCSWDRARELLESYRSGLVASIELGLTIAALQKEFHNPGGRPSKNLPGTGKVFEKGWVEKVESELGISNQSAYRLMERAECLMKLRDLAEGKPISYIDCKGGKNEVIASAHISEIAARVLQAVLEGEINAKRALAGVLGGAGERLLAGHERAAPQYGQLLLNFSSGAAKAFQSWKNVKINNEDEEKLFNNFETVFELMPEKLKHLQVDVIITRWPKHERQMLSKALATRAKED
jgi:hypothetical protein